MKVDILIVDVACAKPYTWDSLENDSLGGTEACTIRLAEGFGKMGHSVMVSQKFDVGYQVSPNGVQYCSMSWANVVIPKNVIYIRAKGIWDKYPDANKFLWLHDASTQEHNNLSTWVEGMVKSNVLSVCVSDWHVKNLTQYAPGLPVKRIYIPLDETCYQSPIEYDKNQLVWLASPHKGLYNALQVFTEIKNIQPQMKLILFNPGYYKEDIVLPPGVVRLPPQKKQVLRNVLSRSLCMFYPTDFEETFGAIAAEANAMGVPVATYKVAALTESSVGPFAKDKADLINMVLSWRNEKRPVVAGQERFRFSEVYKDWLKILKI